jgi:hypothetical protein
MGTESQADPGVSQSRKSSSGRAMPAYGQTGQ